MVSDDCWAVLDTPPTADVRQVKRAYARAVRKCPPEGDPLAFARVREAYEAALFEAAVLNADAELEAEEAPPAWRYKTLKGVDLSRPPRGLLDDVVLAVLSIPYVQHAIIGQMTDDGSVVGLEVLTTMTDPAALALLRDEVYRVACAVLPMYVVVHVLFWPVR